MFNLVKKLFQREPRSQFTDLERKRGYALQVRRIIGELIPGWCTVVLVKMDLRGDSIISVAEHHICIPIYKQVRKDFDLLFNSAVSNEEKQRIYNYILSTPEANR